ncbi:prepilin peptidase [Anaerosacchariphilus polymeriproducens]|uniref:Prepilin peptidase n=1 Tax=Anaerosacchariphilus polymeriproducens TaxID=1812858 RepID=A0A371AQJ2_9FIRM|nr:A24 family peptidase [Anaerosacchariphilus polymeriproducens]RDU21849.1 prepilin peptidase [Anaerosacchariphilus polymeriproducens]
MTPQLILTILIFTYGITIGSFLNVCIYRIPLEENIVKTRSHCMNCGYQLKWYDLIPVLSYCMLRGRCRKCKTKLSPQYPIVELTNGLFYVLIFTINGFHLQSVLYCLLASALLTLSIIDLRTYEIPFGINVFIFVLGIIQVGIDPSHWFDYIIGFISVSGFLYLLFKVSKERAIGGGDVKLMAAAGLLLGWKLIIPAFFAGCILGSVIHPIRMKVSKADHVLAMGPYLAAGIIIAVLWGESFISWYLSFYH